jgi:hypothetical protein
VCLRYKKGVAAVQNATNREELLMRFKCNVYLVVLGVTLVAWCRINAVFADEQRQAIQKGRLFSFGFLGF